jgi:ABC-2 type transport system permease protein
MLTLTRHLRLWFSLARFSLLGELAFRGNFLVKVSVELLWLVILLLFNFILFKQTQTIADWEEYQYLFFVGCYYALGGVMEALFLENCNQFAELVRTGDLDFFLLKPVDEQFLVSCRTIEWSCVPNVLLGGGVMLYALALGGWPVDLARTLLFLVLFVCGTALAYGFVLLLTSASVWFMRNQSLYEVWWLFSSLMRHPREIFTGPWAYAVGMFFWFAVPIMLVTNVPANLMVRSLEPWSVVYTVVATLLVLGISRRFFRHALQRYRSASS